MDQAVDGDGRDPLGAVSVRLAVAASALAGDTPNFAIGDTLRINDVMCIEGATLYDFFDGDRNGGTWVGAANASASTKLIDA